MHDQDPTITQRMSNALAWLGGVDFPTLEDVPSGRDRFVAMGLVLLTTASLAVLSMSFALHDGLRVAWPAALAFALLWGLIILNLDRFLVLSMGSGGSTKHQAWMAAPRVLMAVVLSLVISTPLVLRVFQSDIQSEIFTYQLEQSREQGALEAKSKEQREADRLREQISRHEATLNGQLPTTVTNPALTSAREDVQRRAREVAGKRRAAERRYEEWQCELYGAGSRCRKASTRKGAGPLAEAKRRQYVDAADRLGGAERKLQAAIAARDRAAGLAASQAQTALAAAQRDARERLPALRGQLDELTEAIDQRSRAGSQLNARDTGIMAQVRALWRIGHHDKALLITHLLVGLVFFLIEILPVLVKVLLSFGPSTPYDEALRLREEEAKERTRMRCAERRTIENDRSRTKVELERDMRGHERRIGERANAQVAAAMAALVEAALDAWDRRVRAGLPDDQAGPPRVAFPLHQRAQAKAKANGSNSGYALPDGDDL